MDILCPCFLHAMKISRPPRILSIRGSPRGPICNCTTQQSNFKYLRNHPVLFLDTFWPTKIPLVFKILLSNIQHWMRLVIDGSECLNNLTLIEIFCWFLETFLCPQCIYVFPPTFFIRSEVYQKKKFYKSQPYFLWTVHDQEYKL